MKLGLLSDTHGHIDRAKAACQLLKEAQVDCLVHAGDIGPENLIYAMAEYFDFAATPLYAVWGNMERWSDQLHDIPVWDGVILNEVSLTFDANGFKVAVTHSDVAEAFRDLIASQEHDLVVYGHTHVADDRREGKTRIINPGAVYRSLTPSVAVFDTQTEALQTLYL